MSGLRDLLRSSFARFADRPALQIGDVVVSYDQLRGYAMATARAIAERTGPADRVGILAHRSLDAYVAVAACVLAGRAYVPVNPKFPEQRARAIVEAGDLRLLLTDAESAHVDYGVPVVSGLNGTSDDGDFKDTPAHAYLMFTSGTTGVPKGVAVRPDNLLAYVHAFDGIAPVRADDRCTQLFDLSFDLSVHDLFITWANGACLLAPTNAELIDPVGFAKRTEATCWFSVPSIVAVSRRMRRLVDGVLPGLRLALFCGEPLPTSLAATWAGAAPNSRIFNLYGPTEATIAITSFEFQLAAAAEMPSTVPLGLPYQHCDTVLVGSDGAEAPAGGSGELWLGGAQITDGYVNNVTEQAAKFVSGVFPGHAVHDWYRSGDLVRNDPRWGLVYESRIDEQVKVQGYRIEILEVEEALRAASGTADVAVTAWPVTETGAAEGLVGFVTGTELDERDIVARCRDRLPNYMLPKRVHRIDAMPLNANGKVDRKALRATYLETKA